MNREVHITLQKLTLPILAFAILLLSMPSVEAEANLENQKLQTTAEDDHATLYRCPEALVLGESRDGKKQFGLAGQLREDGPAPNEHTLFEIGSITKVFTGILLAEAVREGLVSLDDPVSKFLPPEALAPNGSALDTVTLESLATHTSGPPRLPPNLFLGADQANPYAHFSCRPLGLESTSVPTDYSALPSFNWSVDIPVRHACSARFELADADKNVHAPRPCRNLEFCGA